MPAPFSHEALINEIANKATVTSTVGDASALSEIDIDQ